MKIILVGSQEIGTACLKELIDLGQDVELLISAELGAHEKIENGTVKIAKKYGLRYTYDMNANEIKKANPDLIIVCGWRKMISKDVYEIPKKGSVAIHGSLLPKYRGFAPMTWPIINGEKETGITMFYMTEEVDTGDIVGQVKYSIGDEDTGYDLYKKAIAGAVSLIRNYIPLIKKDNAPRLKQDDSKASYACARTPDDGLIDWTKNAKEIYNLIRALAKPFPGAFTYHQGKKLFVWKARLVSDFMKVFGSAGQIMNIMEGKGVFVVTGEDVLFLESVQEENGEEVCAGNYFKSIKTKLG